ncbi:MAG: alpha-amylase family glycosyl hydrolase [Weeksellaceae bacterium]|nr:alpha-amylase family glycosyl hydrolase [Weeksellaceae bacterium]
MQTLTLIENDPLLKPFERQLINRIEWYQGTLDYIEKHFQTLYNFSGAHLFFGFNYDSEKKGWWFREWLPNAHQVYLIGDFNAWDRHSHALRRGNFGTWEIFLPDAEYQDKLTPGIRVKMHVHANNGALDRIPAYIKQTVQNEDHSFDGVFVGHNHYSWQNENPEKSAEPLLIYEAHIGMATEEERVGTYREFADIMLPYIADLGYTAVQLMAIQEHPYYGSFGYQVSNFFAPSSRFGSPDDLRYLIDTAHSLGLRVILDVVHSHAVKNRNEGLAELDGSELYFSGWHPDWDSRLFDYRKLEVKRFLLSNLRYWMEEFRFDGFRFDGVTSMLYHHFGHVSFDDYSKYFENVNDDAVIYLQLANNLIHFIHRNATSICEDMSGMPGACRPIKEGGLGFDYRLAMGIPDFLFDLVGKVKEQNWHMGHLYYSLTNRRSSEKNIAYVESHDQALVGDKTMAFWLMDKHMYSGMSVFTEDLVVDRGIALHKMLRLITILLGGEAYMNFMGNEFGHPEWIDFPRAENQWSFRYARRQWSLPQTDHLKYKFLLNFDREMLHWVKEMNILGAGELKKIHEDNLKKILAIEKNGYVYIFNFSHKSYSDLVIQNLQEPKYYLKHHSDEEQFGGFERLDQSISYPSFNSTIKVYLPSRTVIILSADKSAMESLGNEE